jgi:FlaA1/EpsC-like NDP-sugar epimerase
MRITDLAHAIAPGAELVDVGLRPGEKLHEEMISPEEGRRALAGGERDVLQPDRASWGYRQPAVGTPLPAGFAYRSDSNTEWYTTAEIDRVLRTEY